MHNFSFKNISFAHWNTVNPCYLTCEACGSDVPLLCYQLQMKYLVFVYWQSRAQNIDDVEQSDRQIDGEEG